MPSGHDSVPRQELLNVHLSLLLNRLGIECAAERKVGKKAPDLRLRHPKLGLVLGEAEVGSSFSDREAREKLERRAAERFEDVTFAGLDWILLIIYPRGLVEELSSRADLDALEALKQAELGIGLAGRIAEAASGAETSTVQERVEWWAVPVTPAQIPQVMETLSSNILGTRLEPEKLAERLSCLVVERAEQSSWEREWRGLWKQVAAELDIDCAALRSERDCEILALKTLLTHCAACFIIYELARSRFPSRLARIRPVTVRSVEAALEDLLRINYAEAVEYVLNALRLLPDNPQLNQLLEDLYETVALHISLLRYAGWEVLAFTYQRLLSETFRKSYATFYTKLPAAALLARLAIDKPNVIVVDPAMGSGSLLLSSYYTLQWLALRETSIYEGMKEPVLEYTAKKSLSSLVGLDALRGAVALTGAVLTIASNAVPRDELKLFHVPVGVNSSGSLELTIPTSTLFPEAREALRTGADVVIMNPPFTRSDRVPNLIGGEAREKLRKARLKFGREELESVFAAGLAKPFFSLADALVKPGGRIAAVLPSSLLNRPAWKDVRRGIAGSYDFEWLVVSWAPGTPSFSSDTEFREILVVLRKRKNGEGSEGKALRIVNLLKRIDDLSPSQIAALASQLERVERGQVLLNGEIVAEVASLPMNLLEQDTSNWYRFIAYTSVALLELHAHLLKHSKPLSELFQIGSVVDHASGLQVVRRPSERDRSGFRAVWGTGRNCGIQKPLGDKPQHEIIVTDEAAARVKFWNSLDRYRSTLFILRRGQLDTQNVLMFNLEEDAVSNLWWPLKPRRDLSHKALLSLLTFMNSSIGFLYMLGERLETRGLWVEYKKEQLERMPIPDFAVSEDIERYVSLREIEGLLRSKLESSIGEYFQRMAQLEKTYNDTERAIEHALSDQQLSYRAKLDSIIINMLKSYNVDLNKIFGKKFFRVALGEIETLKHIMEGGGNKLEMVKDEPSKSKKKTVGLRSLDEFLRF